MVIERSINVLNFYHHKNSLKSEAQLIRKTVRTMSHRRTVIEQVFFLPTLSLTSLNNVNWNLLQYSLDGDNIEQIWRDCSTYDIREYYFKICTNFGVKQVVGYDHTFLN